MPMHAATPPPPPANAFLTPLAPRAFTPTAPSTSLNANIANDITELIGNTPLLKLQRLPPDVGAEIICKMECMEPCNSVKDRIGNSMIVEAEVRESFKILIDF